MAQTHTLLRHAEHAALASVTLSGSVIDLGGDTHAEYRTHIKGAFTTATVNLDPATSPDFAEDLEKPLSIEDASYDNALLINVMEHIYHCRELLGEAVRITRKGGTIVIIVPYLFPIHADSHDFWRFSNETLTRMCEEQELTNISVTPLGSGVFAARYVLLDRLLPPTLRELNYATIGQLVPFLDRAFVVVARMLGKKYQPADYALGYLLTAKR